MAMKQYGKWKSRGRLACLILAGCGLAASSFGGGPLEFSDRFDGDLKRWGQMNGRWRVDAGTLVQDADSIGASLAFPENEIGPFRLSCRLKFDKPEATAQAGFTIGRGEGYWLVAISGQGRVTWSFIVPDEKAGLFFGSVTVPFVENEWSDLEVVCEGDHVELHAMGQVFLMGPAPGRGKVCLKARKGVRFDDVRMTYDKGTSRYPNQQINGDFEYATNGEKPDYWSIPGRWSRMNYGLESQWLTDGGIKELRRKWRLDKTTAFHGKQSLQVAYPLSAASCPMRVAATNHYVVSVYLKSDRPGMRVRLAADFEDRDKSVAYREIEAGTDWQRCVLTVTNYPHDRLSVGIAPLDSGSLWIDSVQLEVGTVPTDFGPCWYDAGFTLPLSRAYDFPPASYPDRTVKVFGDTTNVVTMTSGLRISEAAKNVFLLDCAVSNVSPAALDVMLTVSLELMNREPQIRTIPVSLKGGERQVLTLPGFSIPVDQHRCRVTVNVTDKAGNTLRSERCFVDIVHPLRIYPEFSCYTREKTACMAVLFGDAVPDGAMIEIKTSPALENGVVMGKQLFPVQAGKVRQLFTIPINTPGWMPHVPYRIEARLLNKEGGLLAQAQCEMVTLPPHTPDIRINHINRGLYLNGEPYLPYGVSITTGELLGENQLRFYKRCGFDFIAAVSHRSTVAAVREFLANCDRVGLTVNLTHLSRLYGIEPGIMGEQLRNSPALVLFNPVDETGKVEVYSQIEQARSRNPYVICYVNENSAGYQNFSDQLHGFPGAMLSCDRYPLIAQPRGWPLTSTDVNGIYSCEERIEWMDRDGVRDRKPLHFFLQAAEHTSREPVPAELAWLTYIPLVNHCLAFTYFGGIPQSQVTLDAMIQLNRELQSLKPALFSLEEDPSVVAADEVTRKNIRILAKQHEGELTVICVNRALYPVDAGLNLTAAGVSGRARGNVLFENRDIKITEKGRLNDTFKPLERHVYRLKRVATPL